jgi:glyoxylase I family protein
MLGAVNPAGPHHFASRAGTVNASHTARRGARRTRFISRVSSGTNEPSLTKAVSTPISKISHVDLVVSSIARSLPFYRELLEPIGWSGYRELSGERGETIHYISVEGPGVAALGLREKRSDAHAVPYDRYAVGLHHLCFDVPSRVVVDERARWLRDRGASIESGPVAFDYTPGYYAVFFHDPDGIKLELVYRRNYWEWVGRSTR